MYEFEKILRLENCVFLRFIEKHFLSPFSRFDVPLYAYHLEERRFSSGSAVPQVLFHGTAYLAKTEKIERRRMYGDEIYAGAAGRH